MCSCTRGSNVGLSTCRCRCGWEGAGIRERAEQNENDREKEREGEGEKFAGFEREGEIRRVGRVTGKAAGSAGVCTTDTCLDSITGSGSHSFLPIKTEKTDPLPRPVHPLRKSTRASPPTSSSPTLPRRIGNCFEPPDAAVNHPLPLVFLLLRYGHPSYPGLLKIRLRSRRTRSRTGLSLTRVLQLYFFRYLLISDSRSRATLAKIRILPPKRFDI